MIRFFFKLLILFFISCSSNNSVENEPATEINKIEIKYKGYYEEVFGKGYQIETYTIIDVSHIVQQISPTEDLNLLKINFYASDNDNYISFRVLENSVGNDVIYNEFFNFRSQGATYFPFDLNFEVVANNDKEFVANFSGKLKHLNQYENVFVYLHISSGSITITY